MTDEIKGLVASLEEAARHLDSRGYAHGKWVGHARAIRQAAAALTLSDEVRVRAEREVEALKADIRVLIGSSSGADSAALLAPQANCSAAQSLDGKGEL